MTLGNFKFTHHVGLFGEYWSLGLFTMMISFKDNIVINWISCLLLKIQLNMTSPPDSKTALSKHAFNVSSTSAFERQVKVCLVFISSLS